MKKNSVYIAYVVMSFLLLHLTCYVPSSLWAESSPETEMYMEMLKSGAGRDRLKAAKKIYRSRLKEPQIFELVNSLLLKEYRNESSGKQNIDELAWYCKVLASSGDEKYRGSLKEVANNTENGKLKKYAVKSLKMLDGNIKKNEMRRDPKYIEAGFSPEEIDLIVLLKSEQPMPKIIASKKIKDAYIKNEKFFDIVNDVLLEEFNKIPNNYEEDDYGDETVPMVSIVEQFHHDAVAWLTKALGSSGMPKYKKSLQMISKKSIYPKLKKYARESLERLN
ncbi:MAG: hypothetical protein OEV42_15460 [Deltaproteobacteria bacterium]|nr:hypothetical protein [Deltaproteobacteria bacterium]